MGGCGLGHRPELAASKRFWSWIGLGHGIDGSCKTGAFPCIHHAASSFKKIISSSASACQGEIKNLPHLVPRLGTCLALMLLKIFLMTLFGFRLLLWHIFARASLRFPCMELHGVSVERDREKG